MSALGYIALGLALSCFGVLVHDLWFRQTAFAQFSALRRRQPRVYALGIAGWGACLLGSTIVAMEDLGQQACGGGDSCTITFEAPKP